MALIILAYLAGILTIASPCILPVLPFVFARANLSFTRNTLPMLLGMAVTFAVVASLAAIGGGWIVHANEYGRLVAIAILVILGNTLLFPSLFDRIARPLVALGERLSKSADGQMRKGGGSVLPSILIGVATGLLWAPCAGPILGLILTGSALNGLNSQTVFLLLAYALGATTSLSLALLAGGRVYEFMKRSLGVGEWIRRALGVTVLLAVVAVGLGLDTGFLARASLASTTAVETKLLDKFGFGKAGEAIAQRTQSRDIEKLPIEGTMPSLGGAVDWINSQPLTPRELRGKVVLIDFWTYSCINCLRTLPYVKAWAAKYRNSGLVVIGVHTPEFAFEKNIENVKKAVRQLGITYPVAVDNNYAIWRAFKNEYWPAEYLVDAQGRIRYHSFGEGDHAEPERVIQELLTQSGKSDVPQGIVQVDAGGIEEAASGLSEVLSPETYIGWQRAQRFGGTPAVQPNVATNYLDQPLQLNQWSLQGNWTVDPQKAVLNTAGGNITFRFQARDLHLVMGTTEGKSLRFQVTIDGKPPGDAHGVDTDSAGNGVVSDHRLYQLVREPDIKGSHLFEIEFLDPGIEAYSFTFG